MFWKIVEVLGCRVVVDWAEYSSNDGLIEGLGVQLGVFLYTTGYIMHHQHSLESRAVSVLTRAAAIKRLSVDLILIGFDRIGGVEASRKGFRPVHRTEDTVGKIRENQLLISI